MEEKEETSKIKCNQVLFLFDLYWFHRLILFSPPPPPSQPPLPLPPIPDILVPFPHQQRHRRTRSYETNPNFLSPPFHPPHLQTIFSGKETMYPTTTNKIAQTSTTKSAYECENHSIAPTNHQSSSTKERRRHKRVSKSMSELELEELKGFMDLGFSFFDVEGNVDPRLVSIVPGLRQSSGAGEVEVVKRPYLSEAWAVKDELERKRLLRDWRVLKNGDEEDAKEHLRRWAHAVAFVAR